MSGMLVASLTAMTSSELHEGHFESESHRVADAEGGLAEHLSSPPSETGTWSEAAGSVGSDQSLTAFPEISADPLVVGAAGDDELEIEVEVDLSEWEAEMTVDLRGDRDERPEST